jgi:hypothetical protein
MHGAKLLTKTIRFITKDSNVWNVYGMNNAVYKYLHLLVVEYWSINTEFGIHFLNLYCFPESGTLIFSERSRREKQGLRTKLYTKTALQ